MINIIKKDFSFIKKYFVYAIVYAIIFPIFIIIDGDNKYMFMNTLIPLFTTSFTVGKICFLEDNEEVKVFLKSLPIKRYKLVLSRYVEMILILSMNLFYLIGIQWLLKIGNSLEQVFELNLIIFLALMIYYSIYLAFYFTYGYYMAQNTLVFLIFCGLGLSFITQKFINYKSNIYQLITFKNLVLASILAVVILLITYIISIKSIKNSN